jgi:hypothetical protein
LRHTSEWKREREKNNGSIYYDFEDKSEQIVYIRAAGSPLTFLCCANFLLYAYSSLNLDNPSKFL